MLNSDWLAPDPAVPQRDRLLDSSGMRYPLGALLRAGRRIGVPSPVRIKYRVGDSLSVLYRVPMPGTADALVSARTRPAAGGSLDARATEAAEDLGTSFWMFPGDRSLSDVEALLDPSPDLSAEFDRRWTRSRLAGYAPAKSVVVACLGIGDTPLGYAKLYATPRDAARAFELHREISERGADRPGLRLPRALALNACRSIVISEAARGTRLTDLDPSRAPRGAALLGAATAQLHSIDVPAMAPAFRRLRMPALRRAAGLVATARPGMRPSVERLAGDLAARLPDDEVSVLLHGDLHLKNALFDDRDLWLIDLDQAARGPAAADIGSFLALLRSRAVAGLLPWCELAVLEREYVRAYATVRRLPPPPAIAWHTAAALLAERTMRAISRMRRPLLRNLDALVREAHFVLRQGGAR